VRDLYRYAQYMTLNDGKVRDEHMELHERVFRMDDPALSLVWPPNGWNCRCYINPLSAEEVQGLSIEDDLRTDEQMKEMLKGIDKDFQRNPGDVRSIWSKWLEGNY